MIKSDRKGSFPLLRRVNGFGVLVLSALLVAIILVQSPVSAASAYLFHPGFGTAVIDGYVEASEWAAADSYTQVTSGGILTGTLYVMQSASDLYLGFVIDDDELTTGYWYGLLSDQMEISFDDLNSGYVRDEEGENKITVLAVSPWLHDSYYYNTSGSSEFDTEQTGGQANGEAMGARHGDDNHFELRFPICSGDTYDFCLTSGDTVGFQIQYDDMYPDNGGVAVVGTRFPGPNNDDLLTIEISLVNVYLPFIRK